MKKSVQSLLVICLFSGFILTSCGPDPYPHPRGYPRIDLPADTGYAKFSNDSCPFNFEYPERARLEWESGKNCEFNILFPRFDCKWHFTYRNIPESGKSRLEHENEYLKLVLGHKYAFTNLQEAELSNEFGRGLMYNLGGKVGSPSQIIFGDSVHLLMTSFYFDEAVNQDSVAPLIELSRNELLHTYSTLRWKDKQ